MEVDLDGPFSTRRVDTLGLDSHLEVMQVLESIVPTNKAILD